MRTKIKLAVGTVITGLIAGAIWFGYLAGDELSADASDPDLVRLGSQVYVEHCASCHGADLRGEPNWRERRANGLLPAPPHDESGHTWHHSDKVLFDLTKRGPAAIVGNAYQSAMPGFSEILSDREIWSSLAYIKSRWPAQVRAAQAKANH